MTRWDDAANRGNIFGNPRELLLSRTDIDRINVVTVVIASTFIVTATDYTGSLFVVNSKMTIAIETPKQVTKHNEEDKCCEKCPSEFRYRLH